VDDSGSGSYLEVFGVSGVEASRLTSIIREQVSPVGISKIRYRYKVVPVLN